MTNIKPRFPSSPAVAHYLFGLTSSILGLIALVSPPTAYNILLPLNASAYSSTSLPALSIVGLAGFSAGIYDLLAAYQENTQVFVASIPLRLMACAMLWRQADTVEGWGGSGGAWRGFAVWTGCGAIVTGCTLLWEIQLDRLRAERREDPTNGNAGGRQDVAAV
jgi:hypothetical protein